MEPLNSIAQRYQPGRCVPESESRAARQQFRDELVHFSAAYRHELVDETIRVYWQALKNIPVEIRTLGLQRCLVALKFFPTVAEVLNACADVVEARRRSLALQAEALKAECQYRLDHVCTGRWRDSHGPDGTPCVLPCECHRDGLKLLAQAEAPIERPALPPSSEDGV